MIKSEGHRREARVDRKRMTIECLLDFSLLRLFIPFLLASLFSSMLLVALWIDGTVSGNICVCLSPFLGFLLYVMICSGINLFLYKNQSYNDDDHSVLGPLWTHVRGPIHFMYIQVFEEHNMSVVVSLVALILLLAQILLLGFKLSEDEVTSDHVKNILQWELVFSPLWLLFLLVLMSPCLGCMSISLFAIIFVFVWIPFFILFVCLSLKLKGMERNTKTRNLRLALILIPFWIMEGGAMLGSLLALSEIVYRLRRDLRAYFSLIVERLGELSIAFMRAIQNVFLKNS
jgi:hypothetical protein